MPFSYFPDRMNLWCQTTELCSQALSLANCVTLRKLAKLTKPQEREEVVFLSRHCEVNQLRCCVRCTKRQANKRGNFTTPEALQLVRGLDKTHRRHSARHCLADRSVMCHPLLSMDHSLLSQLSKSPSQMPRNIPCQGFNSTKAFGIINRITMITHPCLGPGITLDLIRD